MQRVQIHCLVGHGTDSISRCLSSLWSWHGCSDGLAHVPHPFRVIEFFAGDGNVGRSCQFAFIATTMLDIRLGNEGFKNASPTHSTWLHHLGRRFLSEFFFLCEGGADTIYKVQRLAVWTLLNASPNDFLCLLAVVCMSFCAVHRRRTAKRTPTTPWGDTIRPHVLAPWFVFRLGVK